MASHGSLAYILSHRRVDFHPRLSVVGVLVVVQLSPDKGSDRPANAENIVPVVVDEER